MKTLSIITVHKGDYSKLLITLLSILKAFGNFECVESIIVDGNEHPSKIPASLIIRNHVIIQEPDHGIFDGMNKGLSVSNGKYVLFLNSGDRIRNSFSLQNTFSYLTHATVKWFSLPSWKWTLDGELQRWHPPTRLKYYFAINSYCHQGQLVSRDSLIALNGFDTKSMVADWAFFLELKKHYKPTELINIEIECEPFEYSQRYSLFKWAIDVARIRNLSGNHNVIHRFSQIILQVTLACSLNVRKIFIRRNFR